MIKIRDDSPASLSGRLEVVFLRPLPGELLGLLIVRIVESVQDEADDALLPEAVSAELGIGLVINGVFAALVELLEDNIDTVVVLSSELSWERKKVNILETYL